MFDVFAMLALTLHPQRKSRGSRNLLSKTHFMFAVAVLILTSKFQVAEQIL